MVVLENSGGGWVETLLLDFIYEILEAFAPPSQIISRCPPLLSGGSCLKAVCFIVFCQNTLIGELGYLDL